MSHSRTTAQRMANRQFMDAAACVHEGCHHAENIARMRNAWVAYHAGAPWMLRRMDQALLDEIIRAPDHNAEVKAGCR